MSDHSNDLICVLHMFILLQWQQKQKEKYYYYTLNYYNVIQGGKSNLSLIYLAIIFTVLSRPCLRLNI